MTKQRQLAERADQGGIPFTRGASGLSAAQPRSTSARWSIAAVYPAEHAAILEPELFEAVQERLTEQHHGVARARAGSQALLLGKLFDDRGHRMSPTHASKQGVRYRYYVSCALAQGRPEATGSVPRSRRPRSSSLCCGYCVSAVPISMSARIAS